FNSHTDVSIGNLTSPTNCRKVSSAQTISVWIKNHGPYSISNIPIVYQLNNNSPINEVHSSSIATNDSALHTFSTLGNFSASGTYNLKFYTNHPVDENASNDTAEYSIAFTGLFTNMLDSIGICLGEDVTLDPAGSAASSYLWSDGSTSSTLELDGTSLTVGKTMYGVMLTDASGCILTDSIQVIVSNPAIVNLGADTILCAENSIVLGTTISNGSYKWNDNSTNKTLNVSSYGTYSVAVTSGFNCTISDTIAVNFFSPITLNMSTEEEFCIGDSVELTPGIYASYLWNDLSTQSSLSIYNTGVYSVTVLDSFGCIGKDTTVVTVNELPDFTLGNDTSMCEGGSLVLNAWVLGHIYKWQDNSTNSQFNVTDAGTYWVTLTSGKTCSATDSINVWVDAKPEVDLGLDTAICEGSSLNLNVFVQGASYVWQDNSTNASLDVTSAGDYSVELTSEDGCVNSDSITVSTNPNPIIDLGKDTLIGYGRIKDNALRLEVASGYESYLWSTGATENYIVIDESINLGKHEYSVIVTNSFGCSSYDTIQVEVFDNSSVNGLGYSKLVVYPNPSSDKISIYLEGLNGNIRLKLSDMFGRMIMSEELYIANNSISKSMDLSALPKGSYLLFLQGENGAKTVKIILN
ncbi:MAG: T9SS type A sorting domain-containing protein, partial [Bacteroidia bacterium]|nr:T9SS type A sorting domain-containing protein [Bacteroidia bacterium]